MARPRNWLLIALGVAIALYLLSRTQKGQAVIESALTPAWKTRAGKYLPLLNAAEDRHGIPRDLLVRQAYQESHFRSDIITGLVISPAGALGIMQIVPKWHPSIDPGDAAADARAALDPPRAIEYAAKYLRQLFDKYHSWALALAAYNAGPGNVDKYGGKVPPFQETQNYVSQIIGDVNAAGGRVA